MLFSRHPALAPGVLICCMSSSLWGSGLLKWWPWRDSPFSRTTCSKRLPVVRLSCSQDIYHFFTCTKAKLLIEGRNGKVISTKKTLFLRPLNGNRKDTLSFHHVVGDMSRTRASRESEKPLQPWLKRFFESDNVFNTSTQYAIHSDGFQIDLVGKVLLQMDLWGGGGLWGQHRQNIFNCALCMGWE